MLKDLVIGSSSQLAYYWPSRRRSVTDFISSRNIDISWIKSKRWNRIYFAFNDGATYLTDDKYRKRFIENNVDYPLFLIEQLHKCCENIVFYSTTEIWNDYSGVLNLKDILEEGIEDTFDYRHWPQGTPYVYSKVLVTSRLFDAFSQGKYLNVIVLFPYSFNSPMREDKNFLMGKIFDSVINKKQVTIGDTYYYRELLHPRFVVEQSIAATSHQIIGSGRLTYVNDFIRDIYGSFALFPEDYIIEEDTKNEFKAANYLDSPVCLYSYNSLLADTCNDISIEMKKKEL